MTSSENCRARFSCKKCHVYSRAKLKEIETEIEKRIAQALGGRRTKGGGGFKILERKNKLTCKQAAVLV